MRNISFVLFLATALPIPFASAAPDEPAPADAAPAPSVPTPPILAACPVCQACPACPAAIPSPNTVYVADWARLALLTEEDDKVAKIVSEHSHSVTYSNATAEAGIGLGGGLALLGVCEWLIDGDWSRGNSVAVASGLAIAGLSGLVSWTLSPNRDDFYTAINLWNRRHPQRLLSP